MPRYVALLRAVNLGATNKVPMASLRSVVEGLGHTDVQTYIQSGNVLFTSHAKITPDSLQRAIRHKLGLDTAVILRTQPELKRIVKANPFRGVDLGKVHVGFMAAKPKPSVVAHLDHDQFDPESFVVFGREIYFHLPNGMGRTKLPGYVLRELQIPTTVRTWNTVLKLLELAGD